MRSVISVLPILTVMLHSGFAKCADDEHSENAITSVLDTYATAVKERDFDLISSVIAHDDDIVMINAGGSPHTVEGWSNVAEMFRSWFSTTGSAELRHKDLKVKLLAGGSAACVTCTQEMKGELEGEGFRIEAIRMTCVLEKRQGHWRIVHGHWSLPFEESSQ